MDLRIPASCAARPRGPVSNDRLDPAGVGWRASASPNNRSADKRGQVAVRDQLAVLVIEAQHLIEDGRCEVRRREVANSCQDQSKPAPDLGAQGSLKSMQVLRGQQARMKGKGDVGSFRPKDPQIPAQL